MRRYFTRPKSWAADDCDYWNNERTTIDVFVTDDVPVNTGLVDSLGLPIMACEHRDQAAFVRHPDCFT